MERLTRVRKAETKYVREQNELEIAKAREMATIETEKLNNMVQTIGSDTISAIATSGPEMQVCIVCVSVSVFVCCMCVHVCVCVCVCAYVPVHVHTQVLVCLSIRMFFMK